MCSPASLLASPSSQASDCSSVAWRVPCGCRLAAPQPTRHSLGPWPAPRSTCRRTCSAPQFASRKAAATPMLPAAAAAAAADAPSRCCCGACARYSFPFRFAAWRLLLLLLPLASASLLKCSSVSLWRCRGFSRCVSISVSVSCSTFAGLVRFGSLYGSVYGLRLTLCPVHG